MIVKKNKKRVRCSECSRTLEKDGYRVVEYKESLCPECYMKSHFPDLYPPGRESGKAQVIDIITVFLPLLIGEEAAKPIILTLHMENVD